MDAALLRRVVACAAVVLLATGCARLGGEVFQPTHNVVLPLGDEVSVGQTFTSGSGEVVGVDLQVATYAAPADPDGTLRVVLRDGVDGPVLDEVEIPGTMLRDNAWVPVRFDGPQRAQGRHAIEVTWDGVSRLALRGNVPEDPVPPDVLVNDPYALGQRTVDGELAAGDLVFRVLGADGISALPRTLRGLAGGLVRNLAATPVFALLWASLLAGAIGLAVVGFRRASGDPDAPRAG